MKTSYHARSVRGRARDLRRRQAADYEVGQIWSAKGSEKDPGPAGARSCGSSTKDAGRRGVFVAAGGVKLCLPNGKCGDTFSPLAMSKAALERSVKELIGRSMTRLDRPAARPKYQFAKGYQGWKEGVAKGAPVTITVPLAEALDQIEGGAKIQVK